MLIMANRQKIPAFATLSSTPRSALSAQVTSPQRRFIASDGSLMAQSAVLEASAVFADKLEKTNNKRLALQADASLKAYRQAMKNAQSPQQLEDIVNSEEKNLAGQFNNDKQSKDFWKNYGDKILDANRQDTQKIVAQKQIDFGKQSLSSLLADNQNLLADTHDEAKAQQLFDVATQEIQSSPFLSPQDKETYQNAYLNTGILNLALNAPEAADKAVDKYFTQGNSDLKNKISQTKLLAQNDAQLQRQKQHDLNSLQQLQQAQTLWQQKENGDISSAQYFVLRDALSQNDTAQSPLIWGDDTQRSDVPLTETYRLVRKMNGGTKLSAQEVADASNFLINAYHQNKLGFLETQTLQNQLLQAQTDKNTAELMFDKDIDALADNAFIADLPDTLSYGDEVAKMIMEDKAKFALDLYQNYYAQKLALSSDFVQNGGQISPLMAKKISQQALKNVTDDLKLKVNSSSQPVTFSELNRVLKNTYSGQDVMPLWKQFVKDAPNSDDKLETMRKIATFAQKKELAYPRFDSLDELQLADLAPGDKFYFKGRLAVMKG